MGLWILLWTMFWHIRWKKKPNKKRFSFVTGFLPLKKKKKLSKYSFLVPSPRLLLSSERRERSINFLSGTSAVSGRFVWGAGSSPSRGSRGPTARSGLFSAAFPWLPNRGLSFGGREREKMRSLDFVFLKKRSGAGEASLRCRGSGLRPLVASSPGCFLLADGERRGLRLCLSLLCFLFLFFFFFGREDSPRNASSS